MQGLAERIDSEMSDRARRERTERKRTMELYARRLKHTAQFIHHLRQTLADALAFQNEQIMRLNGMGDDGRLLAATAGESQLPAPDDGSQIPAYEAGNFELSADNDGHFDRQGHMLERHGM